MINLCRLVFTHLLSFTGLFCPHISFRCFRCPLIPFAAARDFRLSHDFFPLNHYKSANAFPANLLRQGTLQRVVCCATLVGGTYTMTTALLRCENCENLSRLKSRGLVLRKLPLFKQINRVCGFVRFSRNLARMFNGY